jgi:hypothetical protein
VMNSPNKSMVTKIFFSLSNFAASNPSSIVSPAMYLREKSQTNFLGMWGKIFAMILLNIINQTHCIRTDVKVISDGCKFQ